MAQFRDWNEKAHDATDLQGRAVQETVSGIELINHNGKIGFADAGHVLERGSKVFGVMLQAKISSSQNDAVRSLSPYGEVRTIDQVNPYNISVRWSDGSMTKIEAKNFFWDNSRGCWRVD